VLRLLLEGRSYKQIGGALGVSYNTVKRHIANVYLEFGVGSHVELMSLALRTPWLRSLASPKEVKAASPESVTE